MDDCDTWSLAEQLIKQHGRNAAVVAADKFVDFQKLGDDDGMAKWVQVLLTIRELSKKRG